MGLTGEDRQRMRRERSERIRRDTTRRAAIDRGLERAELAGVVEEPRSRHPDPGKLAPRELEVVQLAADGLTTVQMAERLFLSQQTIKHHRGRVLERLDATGMPHAVAIAFRKGLIR